MAVGFDNNARESVDSIIKLGYWVNVNGAPYAVYSVFGDFQACALSTKEYRLMGTDSVILYSNDLGVTKLIEKTKENTKELAEHDNICRYSNEEVFKFGVEILSEIQLKIMMLYLDNTKGSYRALATNTYPKLFHDQYKFTALQCLNMLHTSKISEVLDRYLTVSIEDEKEEAFAKLFALRNCNFHRLVFV